MNTVRQAAVAGLFYPSNTRELSSEINRLLAANQTELALKPKAMIVPHAGYLYSGAIAATAYSTLHEQANIINQVILLGPAHRVRLNGLAVMQVEHFRTPLGDIPQNIPVIHQLLKLPQVQTSDSAHWQEHSLEVQLPFLQTVLKNFQLIALTVGDASVAEVEQVLDRLWGGPETLIIISSDLSHYYDYPTAQDMDKNTCRAIEKLDIEQINYQQACGCIPMKGLLYAARKRHMTVHTLALCNSGDTAGNRDRVVGYGSWIFCDAN